MYVYKEHYYIKSYNTREPNLYTVLRKIVHFRKKLINLLSCSVTYLESDEM